jgi:hypothetical protein
MQIIMIMIMRVLQGFCRNIDWPSTTQLLLLLLLLLILHQLMTMQVSFKSAAFDQF